MRDLRRVAALSLVTILLVVLAVAGALAAARAPGLVSLPSGPRLWPTKLVVPGVAVLDGRETARPDPAPPGPRRDGATWTGLAWALVAVVAGFVAGWAPRRRPSPSTSVATATRWPPRGPPRAATGRPAGC